VVALAGRLLLAAVFAVAAVGKLANRSRTSEMLTEFGVPASLRAPLTWALPLAELAIAVTLLPAATAAWAALAAALLLGAFSAAVLRILVRGEEVDCNCFGSLGSSRITRWTAARNLVLLAIAGSLAVVAQGDPGPGALAWIGDLDTAEAAALGAGVAIALAALNFAFFWQLMRQNGRLLAEVQTLRQGSAAAHGPQPGDPAPDFELPALGGGSLSLGQLLSADRGVAILVTDPTCGACDPLLPEVGRLQRNPATPIPLILISRGDLEDNAAKAAEHGLEPLLIEEEFEVSRSLGINGSPGLVLLDPEGQFIDKPAMGAERVGQVLAGLAGSDPGDIPLTVHQAGS
jgi:peroxiredoxin